MGFSEAFSEGYLRGYKCGSDAMLAEVTRRLETAHMHAGAGYSSVQEELFRRLDKLATKLEGEQAGRIVP